MKGCVVENLVPRCFDDLTAILEHLKVQRRQRQRHEDRGQGQIPPEDTVTGKQVQQGFHGNSGLLRKDLFRLVVFFLPAAQRHGQVVLKGMKGGQTEDRGGVS